MLKTNIKNACKIVMAMVIAVGGISAVKANDKAIGGVFTLSNGSTALLTLDDCTYSYFYGTAYPSTTPKSGSYIDWIARTNDSSNTKVGTGTIKNMTASRYSSTSSVKYSYTGNFKFTYTMKGGSYSGNLQATNSTSSATLNT